MEAGGQYRQILDAVPVGLWHQDWAELTGMLDALVSEGVDDLLAHLRDRPERLQEVLERARTLAMNQRCRRMLDLGEQPESAVSLAVIFEPEARAQLLPHLLGIAAGAARRTFDVEIKTLDGRALNVALTASVVAEPGDSGATRRQNSVLLSFEESGETGQLRRREQALTDRLLRSIEEREQFTYAASHDLQEPLRMVASYAQLLDRRYRGKLDQRADKYINYIVDGAKRMQSLLGGLLLLSRVGDSHSGRGLQVPEAVDVGATLTQVRANLQPALYECGAQLSWEDMPTVSGYPWQLLQAFTHLVENSLKFRRPDVPLRVQVTAEVLAEEWLFTISDNGIGIVEEHARDIFVIFRRLHKRGEYPGIGIGLSLVKKIVEYHQGQIWLQPRTDAGATFCFTLPRVEV